MLWGASFRATLTSAENRAFPLGCIGEDRHCRAKTAALHLNPFVVIRDGLRDGEAVCLFGFT
jgi:hypothetical protein